MGHEEEENVNIKRIKNVYIMVHTCTKTYTNVYEHNIIIHYQHSPTWSIYFSYLKETKYMNHDDSFSNNENYLSRITM